MTTRDLAVLCIGAALGATVAGQVIPQLDRYRAGLVPVCVDIKPLPDEGVYQVVLKL